MLGWLVPPPKNPVKTEHQFLVERRDKIRWLVEKGFLKSQPIIKAMLKVAREDFVQEMYRDYAYLEVPLPIPGRSATISCPHSYPLFYEALELKRNDKMLEVGTGSGYGAALAREVIGKNGKVVTIEIDKETYEFARRNLERSGYKDILIVFGDGSLGYPSESPYDKICITASCPKIPDPLIQQLKPGGKLITPIGRLEIAQDLISVKKGQDGALKINTIEKVLYVPLKGRYGWPDRF